MINVLVQHEVADYPAWKAMFDAALDIRHKSGERSCRIFRTAGSVDNLTLLFEWDNLDRAKEFFASELVREKMQTAGVKGQPRLDYLTEMFTVRRSAAD